MRAGGRFIRCVLPLVLQIILGMAVGVFLEAYFPDSPLLQDASALTGLTDLIFLIIVLAMWRRDRRLRPPSVKNRSPFAKAIKPEPVAGDRKLCAGVTKNSFSLPSWLWLLLGTLVLGALMSAFSGILFGALHMEEHFSNAAQEKLLSSGALAQILGPGLIVPVTEEYTYRLLVYERFRELIPDGAAVLLTAALFAIGHGNVIQMLYAFPMSLILTFLYRKTGSAAAPIAFHMGANLYSVLLNLL